MDDPPAAGELPALDAKTVAAVAGLLDEKTFGDLDAQLARRRAGRFETFLAAFLERRVGRLRGAGAVLRSWLEFRRDSVSTEFPPSRLVSADYPRRDSSPRTIRVAARGISARQTRADRGSSTSNRSRPQAAIANGAPPPADLSVIERQLEEVQRKAGGVPTTDDLENMLSEAAMGVAEGTPPPGYQGRSPRKTNLPSPKDDAEVRAMFERANEHLGDATRESVKKALEVYEHLLTQKPAEALLAPLLVNRALALDALGEPAAAAESAKVACDALARGRGGDPEDFLRDASRRRFRARSGVWVPRRRRTRGGGRSSRRS